MLIWGKENSNTHSRCNLLSLLIPSQNVFLGVFALGALLSGLYCEQRFMNLDIRYSDLE